MKKDKKESKKERPFYKVWWYYLIIGVLLFGNIAVLIGVDDTVRSHWLTLISGWVSFIATITIGVIAYNQSKDYKEQNDVFLQEQKDMLWRQNQHSHLSALLEQFVMLQNRLERFFLSKATDLLSKAIRQNKADEFMLGYSSDFMLFEKNLASLMDLSGLCFDGYGEILIETKKYSDLLAEYSKKKLDANFINLASDIICDIYQYLFEIVRDIEFCRTVIYGADIDEAKSKIEELKNNYVKWSIDRLVTIKKENANG